MLVKAVVQMSVNLFDGTIITLAQKFQIFIKSLFRLSRTVIYIINHFIDALNYPVSSTFSLSSTPSRPEPNPKKTLNANLKYAIYSKVLVRNKDQLKAATNEHIKTLEKSPECVKKYFQNFRVKYAALKPNWPDQYHCRRTPGALSFGGRVSIANVHSVSSWCVCDPLTRIILG